MHTNLTLVTPKNQPVSPEIAEAIKTARSAAWRLEAEYFHLDLESRLELAEELAALCNDLDDDQLADITAGVARDLDDETEDFSDWTVRCDAAERMRRVARALESAPTADVYLSNAPGALRDSINAREVTADVF